MGECCTANFSLYTGSKHSVEGITTCAAIKEAAYGVRVNSLAPDSTDTDMLYRLLRAPEKQAAHYANVATERAASSAAIADAVPFVASGKASYIPTPLF